MKITKGEITFKNVENFKAWLESNLNDTALKHLDLDFEEYLNDLDESYCCSPSSWFELDKHLTKTGHPEDYSVEVEDEYDDNDEWIGRTYIL